MIFFFFRWRFVCVSLYILLSLKKCLSEKTSKCKGKEQLTADLLSVSQQKTIRTCLQFVISMGVLPSLLPGVGISLAARSTSSHKLKVEELVVLEVHSLYLCFKLYCIVYSLSSVQIVTIKIDHYLSAELQNVSVRSARCHEIFS